ncbi:hypothetical protein [Flavobacterium piscisymbiosum]|uniref:Signal peptidase n=1 Tax=Flavobacterium piscisymbiosum TaxID=2893753 RepID=A0ABS8M968_9FLAO|nr:hypothetical protein [Flavobacterium sp. F-30]MCC9062061.1 hypothetical protein [Flavobacterium sp. F-30]
MKIIKTVFFTICLALMNVAIVFAQQLPPEPGDEPLDPPDTPPYGRVPIDDHIVLMLILAIVLGGIMIYKHKIKKASM